MALADDIELCMDRGWSDGLPVVPPYGTLVDRMLEAMSWEAATLVHQIEPFGLEVRALQVAATAVMAGCLPIHGRILRRLAEMIFDPEFNLRGVAVTTGGAAILVNVSGPIVREGGFFHGSNVLGAEARANATIGRFANMIRRFTGRAGGILEDFGTIGHPGQYTFCLPEHASTVWPPYHTQFGVDGERSALTIHAAEGPNSVNNHYAESGEHILETIADCIAHYGSTNWYYQWGGYQVMIAPEHMELVGKMFSRDQARAFIFERAKRSTEELMRIGRIPQKPQDRFNVRIGESRSPLKTPELLTFIESGGPAGKFSAVIPLWVGQRSICRALEKNP